MSEHDDDGAPGHESHRLIMVCVDDSDHARLALHWASRRAARTGARLALLHVTPQPDFEHWSGVRDLMETEAREAAEEVLQTLAAEASEKYGVNPVLYVRMGTIGAAILEVAEESPELCTLIIGMRSTQRGGGRLVAWLTGHLAGRLKVPLTVVPGNLTDDQIDQLT